MKSTTFEQLKTMLKSMSLSIFNRMGKLENKLDPPDKPIKHIYATDENGNAGWNSAAEMLGNVKPIIITRMYDRDEPYYMCNFTVDGIWDLDADVIQQNTRVIDGDNQYAVRGVNKIEERLYGKTIQFTVDLNAAYYDLANPPFTSVILTLVYGLGKKMLSEQTQVLQKNIDASKPFQRNDCIHIPTNNGTGWVVSRLLGVKEKIGDYSVPVILNVVSSDYLALSSNYTRDENPTYNIDIDRVSVVQAAKNGALSDVVLCYTDSHEASVGKVTTLDRLEISGATNTYADVTFIMKPDENGKYARITLDEKNAGKAIVEWAQSDTLANKKVGDGLKVVDGKLSVEPVGVVELIEEITLSENVSDFKRDVTPDGKPYNFRRIIIIVYKPAVKTAGYMWLSINNMNPNEIANRIAPITTNGENERRGWCDVSIVAGRVKCIFVDTQSKGETDTKLSSNEYAFMNAEAKSINAIRYKGGNFPEGTTITIYGEWM